MIFTQHNPNIFLPIPATGGPERDTPNSPTRLGEPRSDSLIATRRCLDSDLIVYSRPIHIPTSDMQQTTGYRCGTSILYDRTVPALPTTYIKRSSSPSTTSPSFPMPTTDGPDRDLLNSSTHPGEPRSGSDSRSRSFPSNTGNIRQSNDGRMVEPEPHVAAQQEAMTQVRPSPASVVARKSLPGKHAQPEGATSAISAAADSRPPRTEGARSSPRRLPPVPATGSGSLQSETQPTYTSKLHTKPDVRHQYAQVNPPQTTQYPGSRQLPQPPTGAGDQRGHRAPSTSVPMSSIEASQAVAPPDSVTLGRTELSHKPPAVLLYPPNHVARAPPHDDRMAIGAKTGARLLPPPPFEKQVKKARDTLGSSDERGEQRECMRTQKSVIFLFY